MSKILYTVASDGNGKLVRANDAEKGDDFFCPICKTELILRKSGKTGKGSKRPHFAHRALTPNCTPETALHYSFKTLLAEKLQHHITSESALPIFWLCQYCYAEHSGNLLKKIKSVRVEHNMTVCQPDIALFDDNDKVFAVVEVVVTHKPEKQTVEYYEEENIILIQINLKSDRDLDELERKIAKPDLVATCYNPKCKVCGYFQQKTTMTIVKGPCWKCNSTMKVAIVEAGIERGSSVGPDKFTSKEIDLARSRGVMIKEHYSKTLGKKYLANTCSKCGAFAGEHYLFTDYHAPASYGELPSIPLDVGYHCDNCSKLAFEKAQM